MKVDQLLPVGTVIVNEEDARKGRVGGSVQGIKKGDTFEVTADTEITQSEFTLRGETKPRSYFSLSKVVGEKLVTFNMGHLKRQVPTNATDVQIDGVKAEPTEAQMLMNPRMKDCDSPWEILNALKGKTITVEGIITYNSKPTDGVPFAGKKAIIAIA